MRFFFSASFLGKPRSLFINCLGVFDRRQSDQGVGEWRGRLVQATCGQEKNAQEHVFVCARIQVYSITDTSARVTLDLPVR